MTAAGETAAFLYQPELERMDRDAVARRKDFIARWRAANPEATCSDAVALAIAEMQVLVGRGPTI